VPEPDLNAPFSAVDPKGCFLILGIWSRLGLSPPQSHLLRTDSVRGRKMTKRVFYAKVRQELYRFEATYKQGSAIPLDDQMEIDHHVESIRRVIDRGDEA